MPTKQACCQCGSTIKLTATSQKALDGAMAIWWGGHQGEGHGPATSAEARRARDKSFVAPVNQPSQDKS